MQRKKVYKGPDPSKSPVWVSFWYLLLWPTYRILHGKVRRVGKLETEQTRAAFPLNDYLWKVQAGPFMWCDITVNSVIPGIYPSGNHFMHTHTKQNKIQPKQH